MGFVSAIFGIIITVLAAVIIFPSEISHIYSSTEGPVTWEFARRPKIPQQDLSLVKTLPEHAGIVIGIKAIAETEDGQIKRAVGIIDLSDGKESVWDLPPELSQCVHFEGDRGACGGSVYWAQKKQQLLIDRNGEIDLASKDGTYSVLHLNMPGRLTPYVGMHGYALSPDGNFVAYSLYARDMNRKSDEFDRLYRDIYFQGIEGSQPIRVASDDFNIDPEWSPDGTKIAYQIEDRGLAIVDRNGHQLAFTPQPFKREYPHAIIGQIRWSPAGDKIAFIFNEKLYLMKADGSGLAPIAFKPRNIDVASFNWSPTGEQFVLYSSFEAGKECSLNYANLNFNIGSVPCLKRYYVYTSNSDGSNLRRVSKQYEYWPREVFWIN